MVINIIIGVTLLYIVVVVFLHFGTKKNDIE